MTYLWDKHSVTGLHTHWYPLAVLVHGTRANCQHLGLVQLLYCRLGKEDTTGGLCLGLCALDEDSVEERRKGLDGLDGSSLFITRLALRRCTIGISSYHFDRWRIMALRETMKWISGVS